MATMFQNWGPTNTSQEIIRICPNCRYRHFPQHCPSNSWICSTITQNKSQSLLYLTYTWHIVDCLHLPAHYVPLDCLRVHHCYIQRWWHHVPYYHSPTISEFFWAPLGSIFARDMATMFHNWGPTNTSNYQIKQGTNFSGHATLVTIDGQFVSFMPDFEREGTSFSYHWSEWWVKGKERDKLQTWNEVGKLVTDDIDSGW